MVQYLHSMHCQRYLRTEMIMLAVNCRHVGCPDRPQSEQETNSSASNVFLFSRASPKQKSQYGDGTARPFSGGGPAVAGTAATAATAALEVVPEAEGACICMAESPGLTGLGLSSGSSYGLCSGTSTGIGGSSGGMVNGEDGIAACGAGTCTGGAGGGACCRAFLVGPGSGASLVLGLSPAA